MLQSFLKKFDIILNGLGRNLRNTSFDFYCACIICLAYIKFLKNNNCHIIRLSTYHILRNKPLCLEYLEENLLLFTSSSGGCVTSPILQIFLRKQLLPALQTTHHFYFQTFLYHIHYCFQDVSAILLLNYDTCIYINPFVHLHLILILLIL